MCSRRTVQLITHSFSLSLSPFANRIDTTLWVLITYKNDPRFFGKGESESRSIFRVSLFSFLDTQRWMSNGVSLSNKGDPNSNTQSAVFVPWARRTAPLT